MLRMNGKGGGRGRGRGFGRCECEVVGRAEGVRRGQGQGLGLGATFGRGFCRLPLEERKKALSEALELLEKESSEQSETETE